MHAWVLLVPGAMARLHWLATTSLLRMQAALARIQGTVRGHHTRVLLRARLLKVQCSPQGASQEDWEVMQGNELNLAHGKRRGLCGASHWDSHVMTKLESIAAWSASLSYPRSCPNPQAVCPAPQAVWLMPTVWPMPAVWQPSSPGATTPSVGKLPPDLRRAALEVPS